MSRRVIGTGFTSLTLFIMTVGSLQAATIPDDGWWPGFGNLGYSVVDRIGFHDGRLVASGLLPRDGRSIVPSPALWNGGNWEALRGLGLPDVQEFATWQGRLAGRGVFRGASGVNVALWNGGDWQVLPRPAAGTPIALGSAGELLLCVNAPNYDPWSNPYGTEIYSWDGTSWQLIGSDLGPIESKITVWRGLPVIKRHRAISTPAGTVQTSDVMALNNGTWQVLYEGIPDVWAGELTSSGPNLYMTTIRLVDGVRWTQLHRRDATGQWTDAGPELQASLKHLVATNDVVYAIDGGAMFDESRTTSTLFIFDNGEWRASPELIYGWVTDASGDDGQIYVAGYFDFAGDQIVHSLARFDGSSWHAVVDQTGGGADERVRAMLPWRDRLIVAGSFATLENQIRSGIASGDGQTWAALGDGVNDAVFALAEFNGDLIAGGDFDRAGDVSANHIARWNGETWQPLGDGFDDRVTALATWSGELYAAGWFRHSGVETCEHVARWDGLAWRPVAGGVDGIVETMTVHDNRLFVGGGFRHAGTIESPFLAGFDGTTWTSPGGPSSAVLSMTVWDNKLVIGGGPGLFDDAGTWKSIAFRDGAGWSSPGAWRGWITALSSYRGSLAAGGFYGFNYTMTFFGVGFWDGSDWRYPQSGLDGQVLALGQIGSDLFIGGLFGRAGGQPSRNLARWNETLASVAPAGFTSSRAGTRVELSWTAGTVTNHRGYEVYRVLPESGSGLLGMARADGNGHYSFTDSLPPSGSAGYLLRELGPYGTEQWHGPYSLASLPPRLLVSGPTPNPFRETTRLTVSVAAPGRVTLHVNDVQGRLVRTVSDAWTPAGVFEYSWDGRDDAGRRVSAGMYWVVARSGGQSASTKALLFR